MSGTKTVVGGLLALAITVGYGTQAMAGKKVNPDDLPLNAITIPQQVDQVANLNRYWLDASLGGQAIFLFGVPNYSDTRLDRAGKRVQSLYTDLLRQQSDSPIVRTRDLENPYCSSLLGTIPACDLAVQPPAPVAPPPLPAPVLPPAPPPVVPALY